jgi:hypothetical protein
MFVYAEPNKYANDTSCPTKITRTESKEKFRLPFFLFDCRSHEHRREVGGKQGMCRSLQFWKTSKFNEAGNTPSINTKN